jgi:hypothetical protein
VTVKTRRARLPDAVQITVVNQIEATMVAVVVAVVVKTMMAFQMHIPANQIVSAKLNLNH